MMKLLLAAALALPTAAYSQRVVQPAASKSAGPGINFAVGPAQLKKQAAEAASRLDLKLQKIREVPKAKRSFKNTVEAFETALAEYDEDLAVLAPLGDLSPDEEVRETANALSQKQSEKTTEAFADESLVDALEEYASRKPRLKGAKRLLLGELAQGFQASGLGMDPEKRAVLLAIEKRLSKLEQVFERNIAEKQGRLVVTRERLDGLPAAAFEKLKRVKKPGTPRAPPGKGRYALTLDYPTYDAVMKNVHDRDVRRQLEKKFNNRGGIENIRILKEVLTLRQMDAQINGARDYARFVIAGRMAKEFSRVKSFLRRIDQMLNRKGRQELAQLLAERRLDDPDAKSIAAYDVAYYRERLREKLFTLDANEVKEYFPMDTVVAGTLRVYERVLGLKFAEVADPQGTWHKDVKLFEVRNAGKDEVIGHFYLDLFPRPGKYQHMAVRGILPGRRLADGSYSKPLAVMMGNFNPPTKERPSLLSHGEVETFFHEFGHIMHDVLTKVRYARFNRVSRDFVEAPSQMLENFVWQPEVLAEISGHWKDPRKKLPPELLEKMLKARNFHRALMTLRQVAFASMDLAFHTAVPAPRNTTKLYREIIDRISLIPVSKGTRPEANFGHFMGYGAGYYGYLWSEVYAQDIFSRFEKEGLFSRVGMRYRRSILESGSQVPEITSLRRFLGRSPNMRAFLKDLLGK